MEPIDCLSDLYTFPDFVPAAHCAIDDNSLSVRIEMRNGDRPQKVCAVLALEPVGRFTAFDLVTFATCRAAGITSRWWFRFADYTVSRCGVRVERLDWLAKQPGYTARLARQIGRRCRSSTIRDVAKEYRLDWHTVKELDKEYMAEQLAAAGSPSPAVIGIDEIAIAPRHRYRIVISDLERRRPIWFGGIDRSEESLDQFYQWLGPEKSGQIRLAVMDMWKAFRNSTHKPGHAPQAAIIYDKFPIMKPLGEAMDKVRKREYHRLVGEDRRYIKGKKFVLLSNWENLSRDRRNGLQELFAVNTRLNKAYLLKESFGQLWSYNRPGWARRFFDRWKASLRWQRLPSFEKFAAMVEKHWDGIEAYCRDDNKVALGFVESLNNRIGVLKRRAYGYHDEDYFRLKILTCMLPEL